MKKIGFESVPESVRERMKERVAESATKGLHITTHTGKMTGIPSISTTCRLNPHCLKRAKDTNSICHKCYAVRLTGLRANLENALERNTFLLTQSVLSWDDLPKVYGRFFRLESFGDLINENHFINFIRIAQKNPETQFALWTKNMWIVDSVINSGYTKPENMNIVYSSHDINKKEDLPVNADKVFTVYNKEYATTSGVAVNCGKRKCIECRLCYTKNSVTEISELLK